MEKTPQKIRIISKNEDRLIHPSELLLPLNNLTNLINSLENIETDFENYKNRALERNQSVDVHRFFDFRLMMSRHHIRTLHVRYSWEKDCVMIEAMSKKSPYWVDLVINASPYVIETLNFLIESNFNSLHNHLATVFKRLKFSIDENENQLIAEKTIRAFQLITRFVNITIERHD